MELSGWKLGIIPMKLGRGNIGVNDRGRRIWYLGNKLSGGGIKCFDTKISCDYYDYCIEGSSASSKRDSSIPNNIYFI